MKILPGYVLIVRQISLWWIRNIFKPTISRQLVKKWFRAARFDVKIVSDVLQNIEVGINHVI
jgi:hypothetical protein